MLNRKERPNNQITLLPPLAKITITQGFGENLVSFYKTLGLLGHNGLDYRARIGTPIYACHKGLVICSGTDKSGGKCIIIITNKKGEGYKTIYYHLSSMIVKFGEDVVAGQLIGYSGNTGRYTTGPHLHLGLKLTVDRMTKNRGNGYNGCIDPTPFLPKGYDKSRAYHRYGRKRNWKAEYYMRFAPNNIQNRWVDAGKYIHELSKKLYYSIPLSGEMVNMLVYGGWDFKNVIDPAMHQMCAWYKKDEYNNLIKKL